MGNAATAALLIAIGVVAVLGFGWVWFFVIAALASLAVGFSIGRYRMDGTPLAAGVAIVGGALLLLRAFPLIGSLLGALDLVLLPLVLLAYVVAALEVLRT